MTSPRNYTGGIHTGLELVEGDKSIKWKKIPTTETEKSANNPPKNDELPAQLRSEAFTSG